jgi:hypothetical protein
VQAASTAVDRGPSSLPAKLLGWSDGGAQVATTPVSTGDIGLNQAPHPCAAPDTALAAYDTSVLAEPPPSIQNNASNLDAFYIRLIAVARKTANDHVRIAVFGDSNLTMDFITGGMRRTLQAKYGDAGHGFVAFARPWNWYRHRDIRHELGADGWRPFATSTHQTADGHYGLANIAGDSLWGGAWAYAETATSDAAVGKSVSSIDLFYLARPIGGSFTVRMDGKDVEDISTKSNETVAQVRHYDVADGEHRFGIVTKTGAVRMYGATFERAGASVVVDSFGTGALNYEQLLHVSDASRLPMLQRRNYDLVVFLLGTNMFAPLNHEGWVKETLERFRRNRADLPVLLLSPPDLEQNANALHSDPRVVNIGNQLQSIAAASNVGFWDFRGAMGGDLSMRRFAKAGLAEWDLIHFRQAGGLLMGERLAHALVAGASSYLDAHPGAGCMDRARSFGAN